MDDNIRTEITADPLTRMMIGCLLYRLGGEQTFTPDEIDEIQETVAGVQIFVATDGTFVARTKTPGQVLEALEKGQVY